jgi:hypothetical protein
VRLSEIPMVAMIARAWRTPFGSTVDGVVARLRAGERSERTAPIRELPRGSRHARYLRRMGLFGIEVASEALAASGIAGGPRVGLFAGVGGLRVHWDDMLGATEHQDDSGERIWERGMRQVHPYWMLRHLSNNVHALASVDLALKGEGATFGGGNAGAQAIASASRALADDAIDAALVVAYDSLLEPETLVELDARGELGRGFVPGEAAAAIVLVRAPDPRSIARIAVFDGVALEHAPFVAGDGGERVDWVQPMGQLGAATTIVQAIALAAGLAPASRAIALGFHRSEPGLFAAIRVTG